MTGTYLNPMKQTTFAALNYAAKKKQTRREKFLDEMERVVPWAELEAVIEPHYPKAGRRGGQPKPMSAMLRIYFMQQWYGLSDPGMEDTLYEIESMRRFAGLELVEDALPDETTILNFRRLLETHQLTAKMMNVISDVLTDKGLLLKGGTMVDATIIHAPPSTKNKSRARDPEMHQTKKGNQWHFGMKAHIGVDAESGLVHTLVATAAHEHDVTQAHALLHGDETDVFADAGYVGVAKRKENQDRKVNWHVAMRPGKRRALPETSLGKALEALEHTKARIRAKVEHPFHVVKNLFKHRKTRYRGMAKNAAQLLTLFGLANLMLAKRRLMAFHAQGAS